MIKYYKKEDQFCKYYAKINIETKDIITVYRNKDGKRFGINKFIGAPSIYEIDYSVSTEVEFNDKLDIIKKLL